MKIFFVQDPPIIICRAFVFNNLMVKLERITQFSCMLFVTVSIKIVILIYTSIDSSKKSKQFIKRRVPSYRLELKIHTPLEDIKSDAKSSFARSRSANIVRALLRLAQLCWTQLHLEFLRVIRTNSRHMDVQIKLGNEI